MTAQTGPAPNAAFDTAKEIDFGFEELFFSRTDTRGVIRAGNEMFRRVSGYGWDELLGAPHKIVRHPDMPRGLFRILWTKLEAGAPVGAYVRNRTRSGDFYWVFAVAMPVDGGYLSVRLKPSTALFARVKGIYAALAPQAHNGMTEPDGSAQALNEALCAAGYADYDRFMADALGQELAARDARLGRPEDPGTKRLLTVNDTLDQVAGEQLKLLRSFDALQSVPNNMRLVASRLEPSGGPVSTIAENYRASASMITEKLRSFVAGKDNLCEQVSRQTAQALFLAGASRIVREMDTRFDDASPEPGLDWESERAYLRGLAETSGAATRSAMILAMEQVSQLSRAIGEVHRQMLGLETIRVLGRVENGRMRDAGGLDATIDQLDTFHGEISRRLEAILKLSEEIGATMATYMSRNGEPAKAG